MSRVTGIELADIGLFAPLSDQDRSEIAATMKVETIPADAFVVEQGDLSYKFFVILEGSAKVERDGAHLATLGPGDFFGEAGIIHKELRNAAVLAITELRLGVLIGWDVRDLMHRYPAVEARIKAAAADRSEL
ncbi:MAG: cyclic nucleotide-binding domain-containing protein [Actinomycetota bacterium]